MRGISSSCCGLVCSASWLLKLNIDASFQQRLLHAMCSMVIRDYSGQVLLSARKGFQGILTPLHAELRALHLSLEVARQQGLQVHFVEGDSLLAIREIQKGQA